MAFPLSYCTNGAERIAKLRRLYAERDQSIILARMNIPSAAIVQFQKTHEEGFCDFPKVEDRVRFWDAFFKERAAVFDDSIPAAYMSELDQGIYGALFDGEVRCLCTPERGWISSMVPPILKSWAEFDKLNLTTEHPWFKRYVEHLQAYAKMSSGRFGITNFILINSLNFVFELVGATQAYMDLEENPEVIRKAFELALRTNELIHKTFFEHIPLVEGGTCDYFGQWVPGRIIMESVDPWHMTSVAYFEKWGREPVEKIFAKFDGGTVHVHANGRHILEAVASLKGLKHIWLGDDAGYPPAFEVLAELKEKVGDMPVVCLAKYGEFCQALKEHKLLGGVFYDISDVPNADSANRMMDLVRSYKI